MRRDPNHKDQSLPPTFLFGVATSDHQCEAHDAGFEDVRDRWDATVQKVVRGRATDFWNRYQDDIALARDLGCKLFRFSIAWSRVEPSPGKWSEEGFAHYREVLASISKAGMEPLVTLHHFTWPIHIEDDRTHGDAGMLSDRFPGKFQLYAHEVARRLGETVRYWITFNEPTLLPWGYSKPWYQRDYAMPPGLGDADCEAQARAVAKLIRNLFVAHTAGREAIRAIHPNAKVGANPFVLGLPGWFQSWFDRRLERVRDEESWVRSEARMAERTMAPSGEADVVLAMLTHSPERERIVLFTESYFVAHRVLVVLDESPVTACEALEGATIAVVRGTTGEEGLAGWLPQAQPLRVADYREAIERLSKGQADAVLTDDALLPTLASIIGNRRLRVAATGSGEEQYAVGVPLGSTGLLELADRAVRDFKESGEWARSQAKHFDAPVSAAPRGSARSAAVQDPRSMSRSPDLEAIHKRGRLVAAVRGNVPGFCTCDATGHWEGIEVDIARSIARAIFGDPERLELRPVAPKRRVRAIRPWTRALREFVLRLRTMSTVVNTNWWHLGMAGRLPEFMCPRECVGKQDFVGFDYYWGIPSFRLHRILRLIDSMTQRYDRAPVWPAGLRRLLHLYARWFPGQEILIVENGCVARTDGYDRSAYLSAHIAEVARARSRGVPVVAYVCWSITSNREWGLPFGDHSDFGLYHVALDHDPDLSRKPTAAADTYARLIRSGGLLEKRRFGWGARSAPP